MIRRYLTSIACKWLGLAQVTVAGRLPVVRTADELEALIARRHARGNGARKGWQTRRAGR